MARLTDGDSVLNDFLCDYVAYCALVDGTKNNDVSPEVKVKLTDMATIALKRLWATYRTCDDDGIPLEMVRAAMKRVMPDYADIALF